MKKQGRGKTWVLFVALFALRSLLMAEAAVIPTSQYDFEVFPPVEATINGPISSGTEMTISWVGSTGTSYRLKTNSDLLNSDEWVEFEGGIYGDGSLITVTNTIGPDQTFYRIIPANIVVRETTTPVTQNRDYRKYNWQERHEEILIRNQTIKPDVVFFGDSIIHYWAGEPIAPSIWAAEAWSNCFQGFSVENLGFGWDRTENVLWRIENGELDGIKPKIIIIKIGTNNTGRNTTEDIAAGIKAVCYAAHHKQPTAKILLLGILPHRDEVYDHSTTKPVNELLAAHFEKSYYVTFRDFGEHFRTIDGMPNTALFRDGVHINEDGYNILGTQLRIELIRLMQ